MACPSFGRIAYNLVLHNDVLFCFNCLLIRYKDMTQHTFTEERCASASKKLAQVASKLNQFVVEIDQHSLGC